MFAPWCPACRTRRLLGTRRIDRAASGPGIDDLVLRCWCGDLVAWDAEAPAELPVAASA